MTGFVPLGGAALGEIDALAAIGVVTRTLAYSDHSWSSGPDDSPASTPIQARLLPFRLRSQIGTRDGYWMGAAPTQFGEIELTNADGGLDTLFDSGFTDGRPVRLKVAPLSYDSYARPVYPPLAAFGSVVEATAQQWQLSDSSLRIGLVGALSRLDRPLQPNRYGGSGGSDGTAEMAGMSRPCGWGWLPNVPLQLVDPALNIYQIVDTGLQALVELRDGGYPLNFAQAVSNYTALASLDVAGGDYTVWLGGGYVRVGVVPVGRLTADVEAGDGRRARSLFGDGSGFSDGAGFGDFVLGQYVQTAAAIIARIIRERGGTAASVIEDTSFESFSRTVSSRCGWFQPAGGSATVLEAVDRIAVSVGAWLADDSFGRIAVGRVGPAPTSAQRRLTERQITAARTVPLPYGVAPSEVQIEYAQPWQVQTPDELVADAPAAARQAATTPSRRVSHALAEVSTALPSAKPLRIASLFPDRGDALTLLQHLVATYSLRRRLVELTTPMLGASIRRGEAIHVTYPIAALRNGAFGTVVDVEISTRRRECRLAVLV